MKHPDGSPCEMPLPPGSPQLRAEEEERQPHEALADERHDNPADDRPRGQPAGATLQGGESGPPQPRGCQGESNKPRRDALDWLTFGVLCLTLVAVSIYACFTYGLLSETHKQAQARDTSRTLKLSQTAEVEIAQAYFHTTPLDADQWQKLTIALTNVGAGAALHMRVACGRVLTKMRTLGGSQYWDTRKVQFTRFNECPLLINVLATKMSEERDLTMNPLKPIQLKAIYKKRAGLFVALDYVYTDPLGHSLERTACPQFNASPNLVLLPCPGRDLGFAPPWWKGTRKYLGWAPKPPHND